MAVRISHLTATSMDWSAADIARRHTEEALAVRQRAARPALVPTVGDADGPRRVMIPDRADMRFSGRRLSRRLSEPLKLPKWHRPDRPARRYGPRRRYLAMSLGRDLRPWMNRLLVRCAGDRTIPRWALSCCRQDLGKVGRRRRAGFRGGTHAASAVAILQQGTACQPSDSTSNSVPGEQTVESRRKLVDSALLGHAQALLAT